MMKEVALKEVADFINGFAFKPSDWSEDGYKIIRIQNLTDSNKPYNRTKRVVPSKYLVTKGDILISWSATIDIFEWSEEDALLNQHIFKIEFDHSKVDKIYFKQALKKSLRELSRFAHGSTMKHLLKKDFEKHTIPLPSLNDQKRIAKVLSGCEALIQKRKDSIVLLDELLKSTFLEMFGDPRSNSKDWEMGPVMNYTNCIVPGRDKPKSFTGDTPWITTNDLNHLGVTKESDEFIGLSDHEINEVRARVIPLNSVLMTCVGDLGVVSIAGTNMVVNQQLHTFQCKEEMNNVFLMFSLSFQKAYMYKVASKTTVPYMNKTNCNKIPTIKPPINLQNEFALIVDKVVEIKKQYKTSLAELENLYGSLSQRAFKGELDLSNLEVIEDDGYQSFVNDRTEPEHFVEEDYREIVVKKKNSEEEAIDNINSWLASYHKNLPDTGAPPEIDNTIRQLDTELKLKGEIPFWPDYVKYRMIKRVFRHPFVFEALWKEIQKFPFEEKPDYDQVKELVFGWLKEENSFLSQQFNEQERTMELMINETS